MRAIFSYGAAAVIVLLFGIWLGTGTFVAGGRGPGEGERPIIDLFGNNDEPGAVDAEHQAMLNDAAAKAKEAAAAKTRAEEAEADAAAAEAASKVPLSAERKKELAEEAEQAKKLAEEAKKKSEDAAAEAERVAEAAKAAEEAAKHAEEVLNATKTIAEREEEIGGASSLQPRSVRTQTFTIQPMAIEAPLRGRTKAKSVVSVVPETAGTVTDVYVEKGQRVAKGDPLCTLDRGTRGASVAQAEAALLQAEAGLDQARQEFETNRSLREAGLAPANSASQFESALKAAEAGVAAAQSGVDNAKAEWGRTDVVASVAGVIQDPLASVGSMLGPQAPCATIVELDPMLFVGSVPEARVGLAKIGLPAVIKTVTDQVVEGKVSYIAATADEATRSFAIEIEIPNPEGSLRDGLTAEATVNLGTAPAHLLPQSVLTLDDEGVLGVRSVEGDVVAFHPVTIVRDTREGVWVTGLPPRIDIITVGQEFVVPGQKVDATNVTATAAAAESTEGVPS